MYESVAEFAIFGILYWRIRRPHGGRDHQPVPDALFAVRFLVEFFREHEQGNLGARRSTRRSGFRRDCFWRAQLAYGARGAEWLRGPAGKSLRGWSWTTEPFLALAQRARCAAAIPRSPLGAHPVLLLSRERPCARA